MVHTHVQPVVLAVHQDVVPLVLHGGAVVVDEFAGNQAAVEAQVAQEHGQERGVVGAVAGAGHHHVVGEGGDILVAVIGQEHALGGAVARLGLQLPAQHDPALLQGLGAGFVERAGALGVDFRLVKVEGAVPGVAAAMLDDPVIDGADLLRGALARGGNLFQNFLGHIVHIGVAQIDGRPAAGGKGGHGQQRQDQRKEQRYGYQTFFHGKSFL